MILYKYGAGGTGKESLFFNTKITCQCESNL